MDLNKKQLKSLMTFYNYKAASSLEKFQKVKEIKVNQKNGGYQISGQIEQHKDTFAPVASVDSDGKISHFTCNCTRHKDDQIACPHIGALLIRFAKLDSNITLPYHNVVSDSYQERLLEVQEIFKSLRISEMKQKSVSLIDTYKEEILEATAKLDTGINIYPLITIDKSEEINIEYKIGTNRPYVIKSLPQFIDSFNTKAKVKYGKELITNHENDDFTKFARNQIEFIKENVATDDQIGRYIYIDNDNIDLFYNTYSKFDNPFVKFVDKTPKVIKVKKSNFEDYDEFSIDNLPGQILFGHRHIYHLISNNLYRYSLMASNAIKSFLGKILDENIIVFNDDKTNFGKYIIDRISPYIELVDDDYDDYLTDDVYCQVYADIDFDNSLRIDLKYVDDTDKEISKPELENYNLPINISSTHNLLEKDLGYDEKRNAYILKDEGKTISNYIKQKLPRLKEFTEVFVSDAIASLQKSSSTALSVGVKLENDLLQLNFDALGISQEEVIDILKSYRTKRSFHRLQNGEIIDLDDQNIKAANDLINDLDIDLDDIEDGSIILDKSRSLYLNNLMDESVLSIKSRNDAFDSLITGITDVDSSSFEPPEKYQDILRNYQKEGFRWLKTLEHYGFNGILSDDMGLGKTLQVIALLESNRSPDNTSIVITPATLILNWRDEIAKFTNNLKVLCVQGAVKNRIEDIAKCEEYDVILTSYDYIRRDSKYYEDIMFDYVILDEAQYIKNQKTKNAKEVKKIRSHHRLALTGTPIENSLAELWSIFDFLMPEYLFRYSYFKRNFETPIVKNQNKEVTKRLQKMVEPFILRRTKAQVLKELPEKSENNIHIRFNDEEKNIYLANLVQVNNELQTMLQGETFNKMRVLAMMTRLRQLCCDPRLVYEEFLEPSSKLQVCMDLIGNVEQDNEKVLVFSSFTSVLNLIEQELEQSGISYYKLTGATSKSKRHQLVNNFQVDDTTVFLISLKAGGTGLNLTSASNVIHFDPWWNLSAQNQATDRAYRIGQKNRVQVYKLIMKDSIEEKIQNLQQQKNDLAQLFVENNEGSITSMNPNDIIELFKIDD